MNIFVGNLNFKTSEAQLLNLFSMFGKVTSVKIITDKFSGHSRGFAFVEMATLEEAENAITNLNNSELDSRMMVVKEALPQENINPFKKKYD